MPPASFDLDAYFAMHRLLNLHVSPDGARLVLTVQSAAAGARKFESAIWEIDGRGDEPPRRLTPSGRDQTARGFLPDGSLLFTTPRLPPESGEVGKPDDPDAEEASRDDDGPPHKPDALYVLPAGHDEPCCVVAPHAGVGEVVVARRSPTIVITAAMHPGAATLAEDEQREQARKDAGVRARLVDHYPERYWDHDIGPRQRRLLAIDLPEPGGHVAAPRDLTPCPPWAGWLEDVHISLSDDGSRVAFGAEQQAGAQFKADLAVVDSGGGVVRTLISEEVQHGAVAWSPDGSAIAVAQSDIGAPDRPTTFHLKLVDVATGAVKDVAPDWHELAQEIRWLPDGRALLITADARGHTPVFRVDLEGSVTRLTASGAYRNLALSPDGSTLYAIRSHINEAPVPVALDVSAADQEPRMLSTPIPPVNTSTRLEEVIATATDGATIHSWLVLPDQEHREPLPLAVFIHGGPISSWSDWHWRWSAPLVAAQGWAVLLPNPRLSTGYGRDHIAAAWTDWATLPAGDILAAADAAAARPDIDAERTAALGGSYGGYMANWLAVTTDRFRAIVTHASVWDLQLERDTSDVGFAMDREFGDPLRDAATWRRQSPHLRADSLHTPMLVIHGVRDERVPLGNAQGLWSALQLRGVPSRLLAYPDENHWILKPQNSRLWYQTVLAFLDENVLDKPWARPPLV